MIRRLIWLLVLVAESGCASQGLHPDSLRQILEEDASRLTGNERQIPLAVGPRHSLDKLGLYVMPTGFLRHNFEWADRDREQVLEWAARLTSQNHAAFIPLTSLKGQSLAQLREAALRYGADRLLIIDGAAEVDRYSNYKGRLLYWTILGAYLVDGTRTDALCIVRGSLWDVRKGVRISLESAEAIAEAIGPTATLHDQAVVLEARQRALSQLLEKLAPHVARP